MQSPESLKYVYSPILTIKDNKLHCPILNPNPNGKIIFEEYGGFVDLNNAFYRATHKMRLAILILAYAWKNYPDYCEKNDINKINPELVALMHRKIEDKFWKDLTNNISKIIDEQIKDDNSK